MKPVHQTLFRPSEGDGAGNCMAAAVASVLELELDEVPNFAEVPGTNYEWWKAFEDWLRTFGMGVLLIPTPQGTLPILVSPGTFALLQGLSPRGDWRHTLVGRADKRGSIQPIHDPHPSGEGLRGSVEEVWILYSLDPSQAWRGHRGPE